MRSARLRGDLSLLRQGIEVAVGFGVRSLEGLVSTAELLESSVYEAGSLRRTPGGLSFTLLNPPLRMGAFRGAAVLWNGVQVPSGSVTLRFADGSPDRRLDGIDREHPVVLPVGIRTVVELDGVAPVEGAQRVRLELHSLAIPPRVWLEFTDSVRSIGASQ